MCVKHRPWISLACDIFHVVAWFQLQTVFKEIKGYLQKWEDIPCSWLERLNMLKIAILPILINRVSAISIKMWTGIFADNDNIGRSFIGYDDPSKICNRLLLETKTTQPDFTISYLKSLWKTVICCDRDTSQSLFFLGKSFLGTRVLGVLKVKVLSSRSSVCLYLGKDLCNGYFRNHPDMAEFQSITEIRKTNTLI